MISQKRSHEIQITSNMFSWYTLKTNSNEQISTRCKQVDSKRDSNRQCLLKQQSKSLVIPAGVNETKLIIAVHDNIYRWEETVSGRKLSKNLHFEISTVAWELCLCKSFLLSYWVEFEHYMWAVATMIIIYQTKLFFNNY